MPVSTTPTANCTCCGGSALSAEEVLALLVTVDGAGSGLDADTLDGSSSAAFVKFTDTPSELTPDTNDSDATAAFTVDSTQDGRTVVCTNAGLVTVTIPTDAGDDLRDGFWCVLYAAGAGGLTLSVAGISFVGGFTPNLTIAQGEGIYIEKTVTANTWIVMGGTAA